MIEFHTTSISKCNTCKKFIDMNDWYYDEDGQEYQLEVSEYYYQTGEECYCSEQCYKEREHDEEFKYCSSK
jgi:hypothetical protein